MQKLYIKVYDLIDSSGFLNSIPSSKNSLFLILVVLQIRSKKPVYLKKFNHLMQKLWHNKINTVLVYLVSLFYRLCLVTRKSFISIILVKIRAIIT